MKFHAYIFPVLAYYITLLFNISDYLFIRYVEKSVYALQYRCN